MRTFFKNVLKRIVSFFDTCIIWPINFQVKLRNNVHKRLRPKHLHFMLSYSGRGGFFCTYIYRVHFQEIDFYFETSEY